MKCPSCRAELPGTPSFCPACGAALPKEPAADPMLGKVLAGKYTIARLLGEGGMGAVYEGEQALGNRTRKVAVKTLHAHLSKDESIRARFLREVGVLAGLQHPNTIQVYDYGTTDDGLLYLVMEFVAGRSLAKALLEDGRFASGRVDAIVAQIVGSLAEAHAQGIVHRDLKPENVILSDRAGQKDFVKVLDFGIAKRSGPDATEPKLTQQGMVVGTPPYMSPEQFTGKELGPTSDVYSLGVMTYELLTGVLPFHADSAWEWASAHMTLPPKPLAEAPGGRDVPEPMADAVMRALAKVPENRFADAPTFLARLRGDGVPSAREEAQKVKTASVRPGGTMVGAITGDQPLAEPAGQAKARTQIGEPLAPGAAAFGAGAGGHGAPAGGYGGGPAAGAWAPAAAHGAHGAPAGYGAPPPPRTRKKGGGGLVIGLVVVGLLSVAGIGWGVVAASSGPSTTPTATGLELPTTPPATAATATTDPSHPDPHPTAQPLTPPPATPPAPLPTTPPVTPTRPPSTPPVTPTKPPATPPPATPTPPPATPPPVPIPVPTPTAIPVPTPQPTTPPPAPAPGNEPPACVSYRRAKAMGKMSPAILAQLEDQCRRAGGTP